MKPGMYQMSYRGLTLAEAWRFSGEPIKFILALGLKLIAFKGPLQRLPAHDVEAWRQEEDLSSEAQAELLPVVNQARELGYADLRQRDVTRPLPACLAGEFVRWLLESQVL